MRLDNKRIEEKIEKASEMDLRRMQIEDEIERIRKAANSQPFVVMDKVVVKGKRSRFSDSSNSDKEVEFEEVSEDGEYAMPDSQF